MPMTKCILAFWLAGRETALLFCLDVRSFRLVRCPGLMRLHAHWLAARGEEPSSTSRPRPGGPAPGRRGTSGGEAPTPPRCGFSGFTAPDPILLKRNLRHYLWCWEISPTRLSPTTRQTQRDNFRSVLRAMQQSLGMLVVLVTVCEALLPLARIARVDGHFFEDQLRRPRGARSRSMQMGDFSSKRKVRAWTRLCRSL